MISDFTEADLARLTLSTELRQLSDALRQAVAAEDDPASDSCAGLAADVWSVIAGGKQTLRDALADYLHARGRDRSEIADLLGTDEGFQDRRRPGPADPAAMAADLDAWYVLHAQLEPLARVRDPFSRLLSDREPRERDCLICAKYDGRAVPAWAGHAVPPGGHLVDDGRWRVGHGPTPYWPAGTLLIEARRHFLDYADFDPDEAAEIGPLIQRFTEPLKRATGAARIHIFSCMEGTEHFHLWMVPRVEGGTAGRTFIGDPGYCSPVEAETVVAAVRAELDTGR